MRASLRLPSPRPAARSYPGRRRTVASNSPLLAPAAPGGRRAGRHYTRTKDGSRPNLLGRVAENILLNRVADPNSVGGRRHATAVDIQPFAPVDRRRTFLPFLRKQ